MDLVRVFGAGALSLAVALPALAQTMAPAAGAPSSSQAEARANERITQLHDQLHITAAEEQSWQAVAAVMRQNAEDQAATLAKRQQEFGTMNAVQDLQSFAELTQQQGEQIGKLVGPFQTLYAQFSPEQKATADRIFQNRTARAEHRRE